MLARTRGLAWYALGCLVGPALVVASASALTITFDASQPGFPNPSTAVGTIEIDLTLADLVASDTGGFLVLLGVDVAAEATLTDPGGAVQSPTYALAPRFSTSTEELLVQVEMLMGNPALLRLILFDSAGWRGCIQDPATCERREIFVSVPGGFGPGVAVGTIFDSDPLGHRVDVFVPEPGVSLLLAAGMGILAARGRYTRPD